VSRYARGTVGRLSSLEAKALAIGRGEWQAPVPIEGTDEIAQVGIAFNRMQSDLASLRERERTSADTILALNRDLKEQLATIERLKEQLAEENAVLRAQLHTHETPGEIIGTNGGLRTVMEQARQIAPLAINVLIAGESGTGKELLANYLHEASARSTGPLVKVNCAALPMALIESELFGHEKGSFTGALAQKKGKFELAHGGTLFLDEVGELPLEAQAKLLRALQQGEIARVGGDRPICVDVRVIAATNRVLAEEVARGKFREDLYYRLKVVELVCPPLRARHEDLAALAQYFVEIYAQKLNKPVVGISRSGLDRLLQHNWPGNIRELEHQIVRAVALATSQVIGPDDFALPDAKSGAAAPATEAASPFDRLLAITGLNAADLGPTKWDKLFDACERACLDAALRGAKNQKEAAASLGLTETKLHRLLKKHGLSRQGNGRTDA
jgi:transcriptional regulator with GAF, ATPase, and Fis domain